MLWGTVGCIRCCFWPRPGSGEGGEGGGGRPPPTPSSSSRPPAEAAAALDDEAVVVVVVVVAVFKGEFTRTNGPLEGGLLRYSTVCFRDTNFHSLLRIGSGSKLALLFQLL